MCLAFPGTDRQAMPNTHHFNTHTHMGLVPLAHMEVAWELHPQDSGLSSQSWA